MAGGSSSPASQPATGPGGVVVAGAVTPVVMRRLTRFEYATTVRELLGLDLNPSLSFVPEERIRWFENDASALTLSPVLAEQYLVAAEDLAARASSTLERLVPCAPRADDACAGEIIRGVGQRAFRRPLTSEEVAGLQATYQTARAEGGFAAGVELVLRTLLLAPQFLYRAEIGEPDGKRPTSWEMATRLSYALWGSMPDAALFEAATRNALGTPAAVQAQAERMIGDPRARAALGNLMRQWLALEEMERTEKITTVFKDWKSSFAPLMRKEVEAFLEHAFWGPEGTLAALYTSNRTMANRDLALLYGVTGPSGAALEPVTLDPTRRAGLLTMLGVLAQHAGNDDTAPTLRGAFVRERVLCGDLPPPPPNVNNQRPPPSATKSARERVNQHAADPACAGCHALIDPIGFGFERYDGIGRYRDTDNGRAIDVTGEVTGSSVGKFNGAVELAGKVARSAEAARCLALQLYRSALGRPETPADDGTLMALAGTAGSATPGSLRKLLVAVTQTEAFLYRSKPASSNGARP